MDGKQCIPELSTLTEHTEAMCQLAGQMCQIRIREHKIEILVDWEGLPDHVDRITRSLCAKSPEL